MIMRMVLWAIAGAVLGAIAGFALPGVGIGGAVAVGAALGIAASLLSPPRRGTTRPSVESVPEEAESATLRLREERLDIRKERVRTGDVAIRKEVVEEKRTIEVPIRREEVVIERTSARPGEPDGIVTEEIRIPVKEERIDVVKTPVDLEEVVVSTRSVEEIHEIDERVKKEVARVEAIGAANMAGDSVGDEPRA
ncbi:YsnF/AvaK domain-containing protein [Paenibacillus antri]|uniref:YsnF/AvaK domain-containing protein n=1 Tax=Paenibacillus antri TaxID=2582848 RepID=A0A5R9G7W2_9BACL|nr:YsnF/AvaK domain-containing protein [Paenibacillus antri]TLS50466.1 YsnF/AvaK domain-containing protein [Paenibacillus antri]